MSSYFYIIFATFYMAHSIRDVKGRRIPAPPPEKFGKQHETRVYKQLSIQAVKPLHYSDRSRAIRACHCESGAVISKFSGKERKNGDGLLIQFSICLTVGMFHAACCIHKHRRYPEKFFI